MINSEYFINSERICQFLYRNYSQSKFKLKFATAFKNTNRHNTSPLNSTIIPLQQKKYAGPRDQ